ncbi:MAG: ribosome silencing factor [Geopsychrobacter sp.]|nr:ribosome silencing factor [Geopsychrobacter sp.]
MDAEKNCFKAVALALEKKAYDLQLLDVTELSTLTDYLLIASGRSDRQVSAIADSIRLGLKAQGVTLLASEGLNEGRWALLDYGDFMVHVLQPSVRSFYDLEGLWCEAAQVPLADTGQE